ncbi:MAG: amidohydrolase family protein [Deltaproteobacteria bacterium]|nr:amidohydrolase family protein [Deltaproteobacteria bacterium]
MTAHEGTSDRYLMISADCHAAPKLDDVRHYVDPKWRGAFDDWRRRLADSKDGGRLGEPLFDEQAREDFHQAAQVDDGAMDGIWDSDRRLRELRADGVVAEVIFPGGATTPDGEAGSLPFDVGIATYQYEQDPALWQAGPPAYHDPRYEPLWAACAELEMPVHTHSGWTPDFGGHPGSAGIFLSEIIYWAHRPFWFMVWSGAFERHPALRLVMTEQKAEWILDTLALMDSRYELAMFAQLRKSLPMKPSEYYRRQCYLGASYMDEGEWDARHALGVDRLVWGSDYPHLEGSWPHTIERLGQTFKDVPRDEVAKMIGLTAAELYGFDLDSLWTLAAEHGPMLDRIGSS